MHADGGGIRDVYDMCTPKLAVSMDKHGEQSMLYACITVQVVGEHVFHLSGYRRRET